MKSVEYSLALLGNVGEFSAPDRLHDYYGLVVLAADLVAQARLNGGVLEVDVVELDLNHLNLRVFVKHLVEYVGGVVEREADVLYLALFFQLERVLIGVQLLVFFKYRLRLRVQEVEVEVVHSAALELLFKQRAYLVLAVKQRIGELVGENEAVAGIALYDAVAYRRLALTADVDACGVEIVEALCHELVNHLRELGVVDLFAVHGQSHATEAEIFLYIGECAHFMSPPVN